MTNININIKTIVIVHCKGAGNARSLIFRITSHHLSLYLHFYPYLYNVEKWENVYKKV